MYRSYRIQNLVRKHNFANRSFKSIFKWRWLSIFLLGLLANSLVNLMLDLKYQRQPLSISFEEYVNAIIGAWIILGGTRWVSSRLDRRLPWKERPVRRLLIQLGLHLLFIASVFNLVLMGVTYLLYGGFYGLGDLMVIDISVVALSFLFSSVDSSLSFFSSWRKAESSPEIADSKVENPIEVVMGKVRYLVKPSELSLARSEDGLVFIYTADKRLLYNGSLDSLMELLDNTSFFRANRQHILHISAVHSFNSLPQGKVKVVFSLFDKTLNELTVSRTKAAAFRQWMKQEA